MKRLTILCALALSLSLLAGCMSGTVITPPSDEAFQKDLADSIEETAEDWARDLEDAWDGLDSDWSAKAHYWQVLDAGGQAVCTIDTEEAVQRVDGLVEGDMEWKEVSGVEGETALYTYVFMQQKTLLAGQDPDAEREYEEVMRFTVYQDTDVLSIKVLGGLEDRLPSSVVDWEDLLTIHAEAPAETAAALRDPAQFAETK